MKDFQPLDLQDPAIKTTSAHKRVARKIAIAFFAALIISVMIAWFGFLGWGAIEILQWLAGYIKNLWTIYF
jgi:hypothetical protein